METGKRNRTLMLTLTAVSLLALPVLASAQGRGRGWARGHDKSWKCGKFVNCHDARNGRWDGRGPRANRIGLRNGLFVRRHRRVRVFDDEDRFRERRFRIRNRDFDNDEFLRSRGMRPSDREFRDNGLFRGRGRGRP